MKSVEVSAKSKEIAIMDGLNQLGATIDMVKIEVLSEGGLFSKCRLKMTVIEEEEDVIAAVVASRREPRMEVRRQEREKAQEAQQDKPRQESKQEKPRQEVRQDKPRQEARQEKPRQESKQEKPQQDKLRQERFERKVEYKDNPARVEEAKTFLSTLLAKMGIDMEVEVLHEDEQIVLHAVGEASGNVIGYRGETLEALQSLISQVISNEDTDKKIVIDCADYRKKRIEKLQTLATRLAEKALRTSRRVKLEPMNAFERRVIHATLSDNKEISTFSEGKEPTRYIVIVPKNMGRRNNRNNNNNRPFDKNRPRTSGFGETPQGYVSQSGFEDTGKK